MLFDNIIEFADKKYQTYGNKCGNIQCTHPCGNCSGSCYNCLYEVHYPSTSETHKKEYDCPKMLYHYVCQYSLRYASELLYGFDCKRDFLSTFSNYNIMSIGCGGCADLMAFEKLANDLHLSQSIRYSGFDINPLWRPIHNRISMYCDENSITRRFYIEDAIHYFQKYYHSSTNVIVISYLLSYLYNTTHRNDILLFFDLIIDNVVLRNKDKKLIIINDVNSCNRGRDYFPKLIDKLKKKGLHGTYSYRYFDSDRLNDFQRNGEPYESNNPLFYMDVNKKRAYHVDGWCRSAQLIVEVQ